MFHSFQVSILIQKDNTDNSFRKQLLNKWNKKKQYRKDKVLSICCNLWELIWDRMSSKQSFSTFSSLSGFVEFLVDFSVLVYF